MRYDRMQIILFEPGGEEIYGLLSNGLGPPAARIGGEDLKGIAALLPCSVRRLFQAAGNGDMHTQSKHKPSRDRATDQPCPREKLIIEMDKR
jgi:hypothetical protein